MGMNIFGTVLQRISYNNDGTKSITISVVFEIQATIGGSYYEQIVVRTTAMPNTIPRKFSVSVKLVNLEAASTIIMSSASSFIPLRCLDAKGMIATCLQTVLIFDTNPHL